MVIPAPGFDPRRRCEAVQDERCTSLYGVPTMFIAELGRPTSPTTTCRSLRTGIMAGSPCPVEVMKQVIAEMGMAEVTICYGMTETSPVSTQTGARRRSRPARRHGRPGAPARGGQDGRPGDRADRAARRARRALHPRLLGDARLLGRAGQDRRGRSTPRGWMHTGDLAVMDDDGYVNIIGRIKDMVIRGGENVYPREIEEFLYTHPDIVDVQVIGVPDEQYGEELMAWVRMREGADAADGGDGSGVLRRPARALQDPAVRPGRRRVPDDRHRQGPQGRDARDSIREFWPAGRGRGQARLTRTASVLSPSTGSGCVTPDPYGICAEPFDRLRAHEAARCHVVGISCTAVQEIGDSSIVSTPSSIRADRFDAGVTRS